MTALLSQKAADKSMASEAPGLSCADIALSGFLHMRLSSSIDEPATPFAGEKQKPLSSSEEKSKLAPMQIKLESPYSHQVAGHDALVRAGNGLLCKPLIARELWFYTKLHEHPSYIPFVPTFLGCVEFDKASLQTWEQRGLEEMVQDTTPWAKHLHQEQLGSYRRESEGKNRFIVLRDLAAAMKKPCILDLKVGVRQHGDDASEKKRLHQIWKCSTTTSKSLGLRICGMQIYEPRRSAYRYVDKYQGRRLAPEGFAAAIASFFYTGERYRKELIPPMMERLRALYEVVSNDQAFRIYSSSLLFLYDGFDDDKAEDADDGDTAAANEQGYASQPRTKLPPFDLRVIDFAHTFTLEPGMNQDDGYLFGIGNLLRILEQIVQWDEEDFRRHAAAHPLPPPTTKGPTDKPEQTERASSL